MKKVAPVPGSLSNPVIILEGPDVPYGLIKLRNVGRYALAVGGLDAKGRLLQPHIYLEPGQAVASFIPPANAVTIILVGQKQDPGGPPSAGVAELEYDVPWYS
jgi:hypothetical protein